MNCWLKSDGSSKRPSYNHLMAGNDVHARPMIIKATESQPLPSEAFIVTRGREGGSKHCLVGWFDLVGSRGWRFISPKLVLKPR